VGRPKRYCRQGCRQQAYVQRRWHDRLGLRADDLLVSRAAVDDLLGRLYCLQAAVEDVDRDLASSSTPRDVQDALGWVLENARPLADAWLQPATLEA